MLSEHPSRSRTWFNAKSIAVFVVALFVLTLVWAVVSQWIPPSPRRPAFDSYSGTVIGYRGVYDLLDALHVPVVRSTGPPPDLFVGNRRILLLQPRLLALELEKAYLDDLHAWLKSGGELVLVSDDLDEDALRRAIRADDKTKERILDFLGEDRLLAGLGIEDLSVVYEDMLSPYFDAESDDWRHVITNELAEYRRPDTAYAVEAEGSLAYLNDLVPALHLPGSGLRSFEGAAIDDAVGVLGVAPEDREGGILPIALEFAVGDGKALLVAEPALLTNASLAKRANSVAIFHLTAGRSGRPVWIDEYYHGSLFRSNALQTLTYYPVPIIAAAVLLAALVWAWSVLVRFGPPVEYRAPTRRNILEYVDAMARLYRKGRKEAFVLKTLRDGTVERLRQELHLSPGVPEQTVMSRLQQRSHASAAELQTLLNEIDALLASGERLSRGTVNQLQGNLHQCRWKNSPQHVNPTSRKAVP